MKLKLKSKIMIMVLTPIILIGAILTIYSCNKVKQGTYNEVEKKLRAAAVSGLESYDYASNGDYTLDSNGNLKKGDNLTITGDNEIVDNLKKNAGVDATFFYGDERVQTSIVDASGNRVIGTKAQANISKKVLEQGESFFTTNAIINGKGYFGYYIPIKQPSTGETVGMFFAGESKASINDLLNNMLLQILIVTIAICLLAVILSILFANSLTNALKRTVTTLEQVAGGLLDVTIHKRDLKRKDEIGQIAKATETLKNSLLKMIGHINRSAVVLRDSAISLNETTVQTTLTTEEVEKAIIEISTTAMSQATETQDAMENVISMGNLIEETVKDASYLSDTSKQMDDMSSRAITILEDLNSTNKQTEDAIELIASQTDNTNLSVQNIKEATALITSIAEETNLLSLNASIEAARAGEQGRGFAVVANQIQKLAEQSNNSALQIEHIIHELLNESEKSVKTMNEVKNIVKNQSENVTKTKSIFGDVNKDIHIAIEGISNISNRTKKLDEARVKLIDIVQGLSAIAEENAASSEETNAATTVLNSSMQVIENSAKELTQLAKDLSDEIKVFQLENSLIEQKEADMQLSIV